MTVADHTLSTDSAVTISDMGEGQIVLSQLNEGTGKTERVAISIAELQTLTETLATLRYGQAKNTDRQLLPA